ncbi:MAG: hypothetical protein IH892_09275, partial [Planctomycetes bacterium]|nr:hypothetical protein [Planctomycetota bacterium]
GFHIFQYSSNSPGFSYSGDSQWYIESVAQWYSAKNALEEAAAFLEAGAILANPHLTLWHSFGNEAPGDATDWFYLVRQYGLHTYLYYLSDIADVDDRLITSGFFAQTSLSPQQYLYQNVGEDALRGYFADWAARNTGGLDYLLPEQVDVALLEAENQGDPANYNPTVLELTDEEANGEFLPPLSLAPRGWSYNVIKINNTGATTYSFLINGSQFGSECASSHFEARLVVTGQGEADYIEIEMNNAITGSGSVTVEASDSEIFLVIASVPDHFNGNQFYDYSVVISRGSDTVTLDANAELFTNATCNRSTQISDILGTYVREPYQNGYHQGVISNNGQLKWTNDAGVSWELDTDGLSTGVLAAIGSGYDGQENNEFRFVYSVPTTRDTTRTVAGFYFLNEFYTKQPVMVDRQRGRQPTVRTEKASYSPNEPIIVNFTNAAGNDLDWVGFFVDGDPSENFIDFIYLRGAVDGSVTYDAGLPTPGTYNVRLLFNDSYTFEAGNVFTIE